MPETNNKVRLPGVPRDPMGDDFIPPITRLLTAVNVLGDPAESKKNQPKEWGTLVGTPPSFQIIEAGASALAKVWATVAAAAGGAAAIGGAVAAFWTSQDAGVRIAAVAGLAVTLSAALLTVALIVRADIAARGTGAAAQYQARAVISDTFLRTSVQPQLWNPGELNDLLSEAMTGFRGRPAKDKDQEFTPVLGVRMNAILGPEARLSNGQNAEWPPFKEIEFNFER